MRAFNESNPFPEIKGLSLITNFITEDEQNTLVK